MSYSQHNSSGFHEPMLKAASGLEQAMGCLAKACSLPARNIYSSWRCAATTRSFRSSARCCAAQNFTMPALSPTMSEGNIAKWNVKEGDTFTAGDVLLEIETDKASMDVEAQDDGIIAKIIRHDGSKGVKVGTRIGVIAEVGDDLSSLELPEEPTSNAMSKDEAPKSVSKAEQPTANSSKPQPASSSTVSPPSNADSPHRKQMYPWLPSVEHLINEHHLDASVIETITPSGPNNRLLKGDVLAFLGSVSSAYPRELSTKIEKLSHLDLSSIKLAPPAPAPRHAASSKSDTTRNVEEVEVATTISMKPATEIQKRIQHTLGVSMPLSTFLTRATDIANNDLPRSKTQEPSANELFDQILGLKQKSITSGVRGSFSPRITIVSPPLQQTRTSKPARKDDIFDLLAGTNGYSNSMMKENKAIHGVTSSFNRVSVKVPKGDERRGNLFLQRVKSLLEADPGRLIL